MYSATTAAAAHRFLLTPYGSFLKHRLILQPIVEPVILLVLSLIDLEVIVIIIVLQNHSELKVVPLSNTKLL